MSKSWQFFLIIDQDRDRDHDRLIVASGAALLLVDLALLVEDLLGLAVADQEDERQEHENQRGPGCSETETKLPDAPFA